MHASYLNDFCVIAITALILDGLWIAKKVYDESKNPWAVIIVVVIGIIAIKRFYHIAINAIEFLSRLL